MIIEEKNSSSVMPVQEFRKSSSISEIEENFLSFISKKDFKLIEKYNNYSAKNTNALLRDVIQNIQDTLKSYYIDDEKSLFVSNIAFDTIKSQLKILDSLNENKPNSQITDAVTVTILATTFSYFKTLFS